MIKLKLKLKVGPRLIAGFGALAALLVVVGAVGFYGMYAGNESMTRHHRQGVGQVLARAPTADAGERQPGRDLQARAHQGPGRARQNRRGHRAAQEAD